MSNGDSEDNEINHDANYAMNDTLINTLELYTRENLNCTNEIFKECKNSSSFSSNFDMFKEARKGLRDYLDTHDRTVKYSHDERMKIEELSIELGRSYRAMADEVHLQTNSRKRKGNDNTIIHSQNVRIKVKELSDLDYDLVKKFRDELRILAQQSSTYSAQDRQAYISDKVKIGITMILRTTKMIDTPAVGAWEGWTDAKLFPILLEDLTPIRLNQTDDERLETNIGAIRIFVDWKNLKTTLMSAHFAGIEAFREAKLLNENQLDVLTTVKPLKFAKALWEIVLTNFENHGTPSRYQLYFQLVAGAVRRDQTFLKGCSWSDFIEILSTHLFKYQGNVLFNEENGFVAIDRGANKKSKPIHENNNNNRNNKPSGSMSTCGGCGKTHGGERSKCYFKNHPDFNQNGPWESSDIGRFYKSLDPQRHHLDHKLIKKGNELVERPVSINKNNNNTNRNNNKNKSFNKSKCTICAMNNTSHANNSIVFAHLIQKNKTLRVQTLLDTGAESGSFISAKTATWLTSQGVTSVDKRKIVCSCFGDCKYIDKCFTIPIIFDNLVNINKPSPKQSSIILEFWVIDKLPYDVIIGNKDLEANDALFRNIRSIDTLNEQNICSISTVSNKSKQPRSNISCVEASCSKIGCPGHRTSSQLEKVARREGSQSTRQTNSSNESNGVKVINQSGTQPKPVIPIGTKIHISQILDYEPNANGIPEKWDSLDEYLTTDAENLMMVRDEASDLPTHILGSPELQADIKKLLVEYKDIFRKTVAAEPAKVPPMDIKVDRQQWNSKKGNWGVSPRIQSTDKNKEIQKQVEKMLELKVIQKSEANRYSQVLLVPKPDNKWRFCIDFQPLNSCCEGDSWTIPNIQQMLQRIGSHRPKLFAVMDCTSGYHQAPLSANSQVFTAFITFMGIFEWLRVPMGLKGAASYFQKVLSTIVLIGLLYYVCELYIDDIIVHAQEPVSFLSRLRQVFDRLRKHKVTLNPEKCKFGLQSVEYVGHTIDETGLTFSAEKLEDVLAIQPPTYSKDLRSFLGLTSYFRDHIQNYAILASPLQEMLSEYDKKRKLVWTPEGERAFSEVKESVRRCPKLFFMDDNAPVYLHTDASDYGIGGYVFQIIDGKEYPIAFMSKTLSVDEIKWSTIEKECYAIVYSLRKFEYLLVNRHFTLRTDHENLTYVNDPPSPKVRRWKLAIQEFDFTLEHIAGEKNIVADGFSRLLPITPEILCAIKGLKIPDDKYKLISSVHNTRVGHHKVERTLAKLKAQNLEWKEMRDHVRRFIDNCPCCQKMNQIRIHIHTHPFTLATYRPMEVLHIDTLSMGIANDDGDKYILVIIDSCSRWIELFPIPDLSAETAARKLFEHLGRFGHPSKIVSDNGTQFVNKIHEELYALTGIDKRNTTPESHEENGIVERANKEILRHVRSILFDKGIHKEWNIVIPMVQRMLNSQISSVTGCTPAELVFTNASNLEQGIYLPVQNNDKINLSEWHSKRLALQKKVLEVAQQNLHEIEEEKLRKTPLEFTEYKAGSYVLLRYPDEDIIKGRVGKLKMPLRGPMLVIAHSNDQYTLQDITTGKDSRVHVKRIVPFYYDEALHDPFKIAATDLDEEEIDFIVDHTEPKSKNKRDMDFLVRWCGHDSTHDLWLPWNQLYDNTRLHKYLFDNGMKKLIPKQFHKQEYH
jgi:transposase InsO family protein